MAGKKNEKSKGKKHGDQLPPALSPPVIPVIQGNPLSSEFLAALDLVPRIFDRIRQLDDHLAPDESSKAAFSIAAKIRKVRRDRPPGDKEYGRKELERAAEIAAEAVRKLIREENISGLVRFAKIIENPLPKKRNRAFRLVGSAVVDFIHRERRMPTWQEAAEASQMRRLNKVAEGDDPGPKITKGVLSDALNFLELNLLQQKRGRKRGTL